MIMSIFDRKVPLARGSLIQNVCCSEIGMFLPTYSFDPKYSE